MLGWLLVGAVAIDAARGSKSALFGPGGLLAGGPRARVLSSTEQALVRLQVERATREMAAGPFDPKWWNRHSLMAPTLTGSPYENSVRPLALPAATRAVAPEAGRIAR